MIGSSEFSVKFDHFRQLKTKRLYDLLFTFTSTRRSLLEQAPVSVGNSRTWWQIQDF